MSIRDKVPLPEQSRNAQGLISVIIPTYNRASLLLEVLDCLADQTYSSIEIIIVDDGSTDDTKSRVTAWSQSRGISVSIFHQANCGPATARNVGIRQASGDYIYFLDSDDYIFPSTLEYLVSELEESGKSYCLAPIQNADATLSPILTEPTNVPKVNAVKVTDSSWLTHSALYRRSAISAAGFVNQNLRVGEDTEYHWRIVALNGAGHIVPKTIGLRRIHHEGHLAAGRSDVQSYIDALHAYETFVNWSVENRVLNGNMTRTMTKRVGVYLVKIAALGDLSYLPKGRRILEELTTVAPIFTRIIRIFVMPDHVWYYRSLDALRILCLSLKRYAA